MQRNRWTKPSGNGTRALFPTFVSRDPSALSWSAWPPRAPPWAARRAAVRALRCAKRARASETRLCARRRGGRRAPRIVRQFTLPIVPQKNENVGWLLFLLGVPVLKCTFHGACGTVLRFSAFLWVVLLPLHLMNQTPPLRLPVPKDCCTPRRFY